MSTIRMINSVEDHVAGQEYELPDELSDRYVLLGYAEGELSRDYNDDERNKAASLSQSVMLGG